MSLNFVAITDMQLFEHHTLCHDFRVKYGDNIANALGVKEDDKVFFRYGGRWQRLLRVPGECEKCSAPSYTVYDNMDLCRNCLSIYDVGRAEIGCCREIVNRLCHRHNKMRIEYAYVQQI